MALSMRSQFVISNRRVLYVLDESEIARKAVFISRQGLIQGFGLDAVQLREVDVQHHSLAAHEKHELGEFCGSRHWGNHSITKNSRSKAKRNGKLAESRQSSEPESLASDLVPVLPRSGQVRGAGRTGVKLALPSYVTAYPHGSARACSDR